MPRSNRWKVLIVIAAALPLAACARATVQAGRIEPARVEPVEGSDFKRVVLTEKAAQRLDIQTAPVRVAQAEGTQRLAVPYAAVLYGLQGETWVYLSPEPLAFVREPVQVDVIRGDTALLLVGPPAGTAVVTVGGALLYGAETGVSK